MSRILDEKRNPLPKIGVGDIIVLGGLAWFFLSPDTEKIRSFLFPGDKPDDKVGMPTGRVKADPTDPTPPPTDVFFQITKSQTWKGLLGNTLTMRETILHIGPAGHYVVGKQVSPGNLFCLAGQHNSPVAFAEVDLQVGNDNGWTEYVVTTDFPISGTLGLAIDTYVYVRDLNGREITSRWGCGTFIAP